MVALSAGTPRLQIAAALDLPAATVDRLLRQSAAVLDSNLLFWPGEGGDGEGAGDRVPRRPTPSGQWTHAALHVATTEHATLTAVQELLDWGACDAP